MRTSSAFKPLLLAALTLWWPLQPIAGAAQEDPGPGPSGTAVGAPDEAPPETFEYEVLITGVEGDLLDLLIQVSEAERLTDEPPESLSRLNRRAENDVARLAQALRAEGYYASSVDLDIDPALEPILVTFTVDPGPVYLLRDIVFELDPPGEDPVDLPKAEQLGLEEDKRATSTKILDAEAALLSHVKDQGFALARLGERQVIVDHDADAMDVTYRLAPGPKVYFGEVAVVGNTSVQGRLVRRRLPWSEGDLITPELLEEGQFNLLEDDLFSTVQITLGEQPDQDRRLPVTIEVSERKHRSIEAGVRYRTDEGLGGSVGWQHRNLLGTGEQLGVELDGSSLGYRLSGEGREPDFLKRNQALVISGELAYETTDAFESTSIGSTVGIERSFGPAVTTAVGVAFRASEVEQDNDKEAFGLLSLPARFSYDGSDDLFNPTEGGRVTLLNEPFVDVFGNDLAFNRSAVIYTHYLGLLDTPSLVLAGRAKVGTLFGARRNDVPADERFYAGGGGSVRGFGFQLAGDLDNDDDPIGGRSVLELAGELRMAFTETIGGALFLDSGTAYENSYPDFEEPMRFGAGGGVRYFSPIGPFRLDVGFPLNERESDDAFQIYVSIGQAF